jgi:hypothetical protein
MCLIINLATERAKRHTRPIEAHSIETRLARTACIVIPFAKKSA